MRPTHWLPPALWMAVVFALGSDAASAEHTSRLVAPVLAWLLPGASAVQIGALHGLIRKTAHFTEYGVLAGLWFRAFGSERRWPAPRAAAAAVAVSVLWAAVDEGHQSLVPSRTASVGDVAVDTLGALTAVAAGAAGWSRTVAAATAAALWVAAVGGGVIVLVNALAGVPSGLLWVTAPAAGLLLVLRRRAGRAVRP